MAEKNLLPGEHLADAGYIDAGLLVEARDKHDIRLIGPPRKDPSWQSKMELAYDITRFDLDWDQKEATCPQGKSSASWTTYTNARRGEHVSIRFSTPDCQGCPDKVLCTRSESGGRSLTLQPKDEHEALQAMREHLDTEEGAARYQRRAGVEGTVSQGVRAFGLRQTRYRGLAKTRFQHVATATAMNMNRASRWLAGLPQETTRTSSFAALAT